MNISKHFSFILCLLLLGCQTNSMRSIASREETVDQKKLNEKIEKNISLMLHDPFYVQNHYWSWPQSFGSQFTSTYIVLATKLNKKLDAQKLKKFEEYLVQTQDRDGGWHILREDYAKSDLSATLLNLKALEIMQSKNTKMMEKAAHFSDVHGGVEKSSILVQIVYALTGDYDWNALTKVPHFLISDGYFSLRKKLAGWNTPYFESLYYLEEMHSEKRPTKKINELVASWKKTQSETGLWNAQTIGSMLIAVCLDDYAKKTHDFASAALVDKAWNRSTNLINEGFNDGIFMEGQPWDTALTLKNIPYNFSTAATFDYLLKYQSPQGGVAYGIDFMHMPDTDTTAEVVTVLLDTKNKKYDDFIKRNMQWVFGRQNSDGGFASWEFQQKEIPLLSFIDKIFGNKIKRSTYLYDVSQAHITGHILSTMGKMGYTLQSSSPEMKKIIERAVHFLDNDKVELENGIAWKGRWEINYLWATSSAVQGLLDVGVDKNDSLIQNSTSWLLSVQRSDGGWGESSHSFEDPKWAGKSSVSTASQTAWAMDALQKVLSCHHPAVVRGINWLMNNEKNGWKDAQTIFAINPGQIYSEFAVYPNAYPLKVLKEYRARCSLK